jgi:hypothetical protein
VTFHDHPRSSGWTPAAFNTRICSVVRDALPLHQPAIDGVALVRRQGHQGRSGMAPFVRAFPCRRWAEAARPIQVGTLGQELRLHAVQRELGPASTEAPAAPSVRQARLVEEWVWCEVGIAGGHPLRTQHWQ